MLIGSNDPRFQNKIPLNPFGENKMSTNRRDFLKLAGAAAAAITSTAAAHAGVPASSVAKFDD